MRNEETMELAGGAAAAAQDASAGPAAPADGKPPRSPEAHSSEVHSTKPRSPKPRSPMSERRVSIIGAMLIAVGPLSMALFTPAMPQIVEAFGTTEAAGKMTLSLYFAGFALGQLVCGPLSDGFGRKPVTMAFLSFYILASLFALLAPTIETLIVARAFQGVGAAVGLAVARAIVRDLFTTERSARVMNLLWLILSIGPAVAPTVGGITMEFFGWHAIFLLMLIMGCVIMVVVQFGLDETVDRDLSRIRPVALARSYASLFSTSYFMSSSLVVACLIGAIYTQATILPFILMDRVGLSPTAFGFGMLMQSGSFILGSLVVRRLIDRFGSRRIVPVGFVCVAFGCVIMAILLRTGTLSFLTVMGPVAFYAFGIPFILPAMNTAALAPFPHIAGSASALSGFLQMGGGLAGGMVSALFVDPVHAMGTVVPAMGILAIVCWAWWRILPEPVMAYRVVTPPAS